MHMSMIISNECISCDVCEPECPNGAISHSDTVYMVNPAKCTECIGHYDAPQCIPVCPIDCIHRNSAHLESQDELLAKFYILNPAT